MRFKSRTEGIEELRCLPSYNCVTADLDLSASKFFVSFVSFVVNFTGLS
jgi:hypothetical protein